MRENETVMAKSLYIALARARMGPALVSLAICLSAAAQMPEDIPLPRTLPGLDKSHNIFDQYPDRPSLSPALTIPLGPAGYSMPGPIYETRLDTLVSLDFLDENRLLFTFHSSGGLLQRSESAVEDKERHIRAVVISIPSGKIDAQATWILHDHMRYLWMLHDGHFLLRDGEGIQLGDENLKLKPYVQFNGHLLWIEMDPAQQFLMTNSLVPASTPVTAEEASNVAPAPAGSGTDSATTPRLVIRTLNLGSGEVFRTSRVPWTYQTSDWPMNSDGYAETASVGKRRWKLNLHYFAGGTRTIAAVTSTCVPKFAFISRRELFATTCEPEGGWGLNAIMVGGEYPVWQQHASTNSIWPLLVMSPDGSWIARETLVLDHPLNGHNRHYDMHDVEGQMVRVLNAANGNLILEAPTAPLLLSGGNVAFSPSGDRVAILNRNSIEVFNLPHPLSSLNPDH